MRHSVANKANDESDARMFAPAAARNSSAIVAALTPYLPDTGHVLEVASGTGEHVVKLAEAKPNLMWHPTDIEEDRLKSIAAWTAHEGRSNIRPPVSFNAITDSWSGGQMNAIYLSNLIHLISSEEASQLITNLTTICVRDGIIAIYGPFKRDDGFASQGDQDFDASLRLRDPAIGYKSTQWMDEQFSLHGMRQREQIAMPANNLLILWNKA